MSKSLGQQSKFTSRMLVFDADAWRKAGGDVGDNSCFWKPAEIVTVNHHKDGDDTATVVFENGRESHGHLIKMMRELDEAS